MEREVKTMKKNTFHKLLAMMLAFMLVIGSAGLTALADVEIYADGKRDPDEGIEVETLSHAGDVEEARAVTEEGKNETVSLTVDGNVINEDINTAPDAEAAVEVRVRDGSATVKTGDIIEKDEDAIEALIVSTRGDDAKADVTTGKIESESNGVFIQNEGGSITVTTGGIDTENKGEHGWISDFGLKIETKSDYSYEKEITEDEFNTIAQEQGQSFEPNSGYATIYSFPPGGGAVTLLAERRIVDIKENSQTGQSEYEYEYIKNEKVSVEGGSTTVTVNGGITVGSDRNVQILNYGDNQSVNVTINGSVASEIENESNYVNVMTLNAFAGGKNSETTLAVNGDIKATAETNNEDPQFVDAQGINLKAYNGGVIDARIKGNIAVSGEMTASGLRAENGEHDSGIKSVSSGSTEETVKKDPSKIEAEITGNISVEGESSTGICVLSGSGSTTIDVTGDVSAQGDEAESIYTDNQGGTIGISVVGNVNSDNTGLDLNSTVLTQRTRYETYKVSIDKENDECIETKTDDYGSAYSTYLHKDGDQEIYYTVMAYDYETPDGEKYHNEYVSEAWTKEEKVSRDASTTSVRIEGDVTAAETGVKIDLDNDKSKIDVIVDGALSGKTQSVLVSEDTISDNLTLTVWEITPNKDGNLVERETEDGKTKADKDLEKKIQYIIRIEPTQAEYITTQGTTAYEGYNVAGEGDTVTLKLSIPAGRRVVNAFNGTDSKVSLLVDADGNYYLEVPRGGGVMLSLELEVIPDPVPNTETQTTQVTTAATKVAALKAAADTAETTALKALIEDAVKNSDILSVLPDDIKSKLPAGVSKLVEAITLRLENYESEMGAVTVKVQPANKKYNKGDKATVVIALPDGKGGYTWFLIEGEGQEDGTLALSLPAATAARLAGKTFITMILE